MNTTDSHRPVTSSGDRSSLENCSCESAAGGARVSKRRRDCANDRGNEKHLGYNDEKRSKKKKHPISRKELNTRILHQGRLCRGR